MKPMVLLRWKRWKLEFREVRAAIICRAEYQKGKSCTEELDDPQIFGNTFLNDSWIKCAHEKVFKILSHQGNAN